MAKEYQIGALWIGGSLSYVEQLCLKSFIDAGQHVKLYTYGEVKGVPKGVEIADGNDVMAMNSALTYRRVGSPALQADIFRYHLLRDNDDIIWADTDAYCVKPFTTDTGHFYAWESAHRVNIGVLRLPPDSDTLGALLDFTSDEYAIPEWLPAAERRAYEAARDKGEPIHAGDMAWGTWGPLAFTHFLHKTGEIKFALPRDALYPIAFKERGVMVRDDANAERFITPDTYSIHLYGRRMRNRLQQIGGAPPQNSLIGRLMEKHDVTPSDGPLPKLPPKIEPLKPQDRQGRGAPNLTDMADARGFDQGSLRHNYTNLYQMLLLPRRLEDLHLLLVGLDGGRAVAEPEAWDQTAQQTLEMWREYFPKARISAIDRADAVAQKFKGVTYHSASLESAADLATLIDDPVDVVIDDATHASHHQQNALRALFPKLADGGLYIIEDLRSQPASLEKQGMVKTSALFQGYLQSGVFDHPDENAKVELDALRADISGCFLFQAKFQKHRRDQVLVLHKR